MTVHFLIVYLLAVCCINSRIFPLKTVYFRNDKTYWITTGLYPQQFILQFVGEIEISKIKTTTTNVSVSIHGLSCESSVHSISQVRKILVEKCVGMSPTAFETVYDVEVRDMLCFDRYLCDSLGQVADRNGRIQVETNQVDWTQPLIRSGLSTSAPRTDTAPGRRSPRPPRLASCALRWRAAGTTSRQSTVSPSRVSALAHEPASPQPAAASPTAASGEMKAHRARWCCIEPPAQAEVSHVPGLAVRARVSGRPEVPGLRSCKPTQPCGGQPRRLGARGALVPPCAARQAEPALCVAQRRPCSRG